MAVDASLDYITYRGVSMNAMRLRNKFIDTILLCRNKRLPAHRLVLCCRSPFFHEILVHDAISNKKQLSAINMEDVEARVMEPLLEYMYLGIINTMIDIPPMDFPKILNAADKFKVCGAVFYLASVWLHHRTPESVSIIWKWAVESNNRQIEHEIIKYIIRHIHQMSSRYEFLCLTPSQMTAVLSDPATAHIEPQDVVMAAILNWVEVNPSKRREYFQNFVSFVAIHKLSEDYVQFLLTSESLMQIAPDFKFKGIKCKNVNKKLPQTRSMRSAYYAGSGDQTQTPMSSDHTNIDAPMQDVSNSSVTRSLSVVASNSKTGEAKSSLLNKTIQASKRDTTLSPTTTNHTCYYTKWQLLQQQIRSCGSLMFDFGQAINIVEKQTIMVVGRDDMNRLVVHLYIPEKKTWSLSHEIKIHPDRDQMAYSYYNGKLFLIGGMDMFQRFQPDVNIFDLMSQSVKEGPHMRVCRTMASVACDGRRAYVIGGLNRFDNWMTHVECLDMGAELWRIIPSMKEKRQTPGVVAVNGELFIVSGFTNRCEKYDPYSECWKDVIPMPEFFSQTTVFCCEFEGKLYAFRYFKPDRVCCLDVTKNVWTVFRSMGRPPERIVCMMNMGNEFWTIDQLGKLFVYDALINFWSSCFVVPKSLTRPMKLFNININDLKEAEKNHNSNNSSRTAFNSP